MSNKYKIVIILALLCFLSVNAVFANDMNSTIASTEDLSQDLTSINDNNTLLQGSKSFSDLNQDINSHQDSEINLTSDYSYSSGDSDFSQGVIISRSVTINGNGHTLDGNNQARIFQITDNSLSIVLKNIILINGKSSGNGGAISGKCTAVNCTFINNTAEKGGALYKVSATDCIFEDNNAKEGGAIYIDAKNINILNCTFENNEATEFGGAISVSDVIGSTISNCTFKRNKAKNGGSLSVLYSQKVSITNSEFIENEASVDGGAIHFEFALHNTLYNCDFENNDAEQHGGAISWILTTGNITHNRFKHNTATGNGGGIYIEISNTTAMLNNQILTDCNFSDNSAQNGGALYCGEFYKLRDGVFNFTGNSARDCGGAVYCNDYCQFTNSLFSNNEAMDGGALYCHDYCDIYVSKFINNNAGDRGGAIFSNMYTFLFDIEFKNNAAHNGGAMYCYRECTISKAQFTDNTANYQGGAFYCDDYCSFYNVKFNNNKALYGYGGAVYCRGNNEFLYSEFNQNYAADGPAIYALGPSNIINNTVFLLNKQETLQVETSNKDFKSTVQLLGDKYHFNAVYSAYELEYYDVTYWNGTIANTDDLDTMGAPGINVTLEIFDSNNNLVKKDIYTTDNNGTFVFDYFDLDGGSYTCKITHEDDDYYAEFSETYQLGVGEFAKLQHLLDLAKDDGIVNLTQNYTFTVGYDTIQTFIVNCENLTINGNGYTIDGSNHGTSFSLANMKNINFLNCTFKNGVNFDLKGDNVLISNCDFENITNLRVSTAKSCQIIDCNFDNSNAESEFGACDLRNIKNVLIKNSNFTNIHATGSNGAAIYLSDNNAESIIGCNFINNTYEYGGAIRGNKINNINLINCTFENNSARQGGAINIGTLADGMVNIDGCIFINNTAERGGAIDVLRNARIRNSVFLKNKASTKTFNMNADLDTITVNFAGSNNYINAIYFYGEILSFENVTYWDGTITNTDVNSPIATSPGVNITIKAFDEDGNLIFQTVEKTDKNGKLVYDVIKLPFETKSVVCYHENDDYYARSVNVTRDVTRMGDYDRLQLLINEAGENGVVSLTRNYTYSTGFDTIFRLTINYDNITINGNGYSINGLNQASMIYSEKEGLTLNNITFIDGRRTPIYLGASTEINDCNFINNDIGSSYANIWLFAGNLILKNTNFINITGRNIKLDDGTTASIYNCNFINNTQAISAGGNSLIGTIEKILISGSNFVNNSVDNAAVLELKAEIVIIENSNFTNNKGAAGGAIRFEGDYFNITNSTFTGNIANDNGGAIYLKTSESNIDGCTFSNNSANQDGGAIYINGQGYLNVYNSVFTFNKANVGSAIHYGLGYIVLFNSTLLDNKAESHELWVDDIDSSIIIKFTGNNNFAHAIFNNFLIDFHNVTYWNGAVVNSDDVSPVNGQFRGVNITLEIRDHEDTLVENITLVTDEQNTIYYYPSSLGGGNYSFKAYHLDDSYYSFIDGCNGTFSVNRSESSVKINMENGTELYYPNFNISFNITNKTSVRVVITNIDGSQVYVNQTTENDYFIVDLDANEEYYNITVYNVPSIKYFGSQDSKLFKISKIKPTIIIDPIPDVYYNNTVDVTFDGENFETVNVTVCDIYGNIVFSQVSTNKSVTIPVLPVGTYNITLTTEEYRYYSKASNSTTFNILKVPNNVQVTVENVTYGDASVIVVTADIDGVYTVDVNGTLSNVTVVGKHGNITMSLGAGKYYANATFDNGNYSTNINNTIFEVYKAINNIVVSVENVTYGNSSVVIVSADVDGVYTVDVNGTVINVTVADNEGSFTLPLGAGKYYANATYSNGNYSTSITNAVFEVYKAINNGRFVVTNVTYGRESEIIITTDINGVYSIDLNGNVRNVTVVNNVGFFRTYLDAGKYYVKATFDNENYTTNISDDSFEVYKAVNNVVVTVENVTYGNESVIEISANANGVYTVDVNGTIRNVTVVDYKGNLTLSLGAGKYYANVTFNNGNYYTIAANTSFEVYKAMNNAVVNVTREFNSQNIILEVTADVDGVYTLDLNGTISKINVEDGKYSVSLALPVGKYYANVTFENGNYSTVSSNAEFEIDEIVNNIKVIAENVTYGNDVIIKVVADFDGVYTLDVNGSINKINVINGSYSTSLSLGAGKYYANVTFYDGNYSTNVTNAVFEVYKALNNVVVSVENVTYGNESVIVVTADVDGVHAVDVNGTIRDVTVVDHKGNFTLSLGSGSYYANASFVNGNYSTNVTNAVFEVYKALNNVVVSVVNVTYGNSSVVIVSADADGVYAVDVNGTIYNVTVVNHKGNFTLSLDAGSYYANASFVNGNYSTNVTNAVFEVYKALNNVVVSVVNVTYGNESVVVVSADVDGVYSVDVNGTIYNVTVGDHNGNVSLSLAAGKYYANVTFEIDNYVSKITNTSFEVYKALNNVVVSVVNVTYGNKSVVVVSADVDGVYAVDVNGTIYNVTVVDHNGNVSLSLGAGKYYANATYDNGNYSTSVSNASFEVYKALNNVVVSVENVAYGEDSVVVVSADVDGVYTLDLNGNVSEINVADGKYSVSVRLGVGKYYANVTFEHENYTTIITNASFEVYKAINNVQIYVLNVDYGKDSMIIVSADVDGVYTVDVNGTITEVSVEDNVGTFTLSLGAGNYYANATFEHENYTSIITNASFEVYKAINNVRVIAKNVDYGNDVVLTVVADVDGEYTLDFNGNVTKINVVNGNYSTSLSLGVGKYYANVTFDNGNYSSIITNASFEVYKVVNNVRVIVNNVVYGNDVVITVVADVDGEYALDFNGQITTINVVNGNYSVSVRLGVGKYYANVTFDNGNYSTSATNASFEVYKAVNNVRVIANSVAFGQVVNLTVIADVDGEYTLDINGNVTKINVVGGNYSTSLSLGVGKYYANVTFDNGNYSSIITNASFEVNEAVNNVRVIANSVVYGNDVVITVVADVDGEYTLDFNGNVTKINVVNGNYSVSLSLGVGKYYANVTFNGNRSSSITNASFEVYKAVNNVKVIVNNVVYCNDVVLTVVADVDGEYTLDFNGNITKINVVNGNYSTSLSLGAGKYYANVTFDNGNYSTSAVNASFEVYKAVNNVKVIVDSVSYGKNVTLRVVADVDGVYTLDFNGQSRTINVVNGSYSDSLSLGVGKYYANVTFDNGNYSSVVTNASFEVYKAVNNVMVIAKNVVYGNDVVISVVADVDGVYTLDINGNVRTINVVNGTYSLSLTLEIGKYYANVSFADPNYDTIIYNATFKVLPVGDYNMTIESVYDDGVYVFVILPSLATGNVTLNIDGENYTAVVNNGIAFFDVPDLNPGDYNITVRYSGDNHYASKTSNSTVHVKKILIDAYDAKYGWANSIKYSIKLIDEDGNAVKDKEVLFYINGETFKSITNSNGVATVTLSLKIGSYDIQISYLSESVVKKINVVSRFSANKNINMYYYDGSKYTFKVYGDNGQLVGANQNVVIKLNKKTYTVKTNKNGVASFTIPQTLKKLGTYTITATYKGQTIKNTVKVKQILSSKKKVKVKRTAKKLVLKAKLKKKIKGKKIVFKFKGKKYVAKTNKKGIAKVKIKKKVIKKLKKGKTYKVTISYYKMSIKTKVKVK